MPSVILASASYDHTIRFWEAPSGICYRTIPYSDSQVNVLCISPDKQFLAAAGNPHVRLFEAHSSNPNPITSFDGHTGNVTALGFQSGGKWMYSGSEDATVKIWDIRTPGCQREQDIGCFVNDIALHPNESEMYIAGQDGKVRIWDLAANKIIREVASPTETPARVVDVAPDASSFLVGDNNGDLTVYSTDVTVAAPLRHAKVHSSYVLSACFAPDGNTIATTSADCTAKLWAVSDLALAKTLDGHTGWVWDCVFSADSAYLVTASSDHSLRLWDLSKNETIRHYTGHHKSVICVALNDVA